MVITNSARKLMNNWIVNRVSEEYSMGPDFDNRWRTGGSLEQIIAEAQLDPLSIWNGIKKFANDREHRLTILKKSIPD